jgi:hypothetical protein
MVEHAKNSIENYGQKEIFHQNIIEVYSHHSFNAQTQESIEECMCVRVYFNN